MQNHPEHLEVFSPNTTDPFHLSRESIALFQESPRAFYVQHRLGVFQPQSPLATIDLTVKHLLKKEFNVHRINQTPHDIMIRYGVDAVPFMHKDLGDWTENYNGLQAFHGPTNLIVCGQVDDVWHDSRGELYVVEYRPTTKKFNPNSPESLEDHHKRQIEIYQWILRQKGHHVSDLSYFVFCVGRTDKEAFDAKLEFDVHLLPYPADASWVEPALENIKQVLMSEELPQNDSNNPLYTYAKQVAKAEKEFKKKTHNPSES